MFFSCEMNGVWNDGSPKFYEGRCTRMPRCISLVSCQSTYEPGLGIRPNCIIIPAASG